MDAMKKVDAMKKKKKRNACGSSLHGQAVTVRRSDVTTRRISVDERVGHFFVLGLKRDDLATTLLQRLLHIALLLLELLDGVLAFCIVALLPQHKHLEIKF